MIQIGGEDSGRLLEEALQEVKVVPGDGK